VAAANGGHPPGQPLIQGIAGTLKDYADAAQQVIGMASNSSYALIFMNNAEQAYGAFGQLQARLADRVEADKLHLVADVQAEIRAARLIFIASAVAAAIVAILASVALGNLISRPVVLLVQATHRLAEGDTDVRIPGAGRRDEIGGMAAGLEVFRVNVIENRRLAIEQDLARQSAQAAQQAALRHMAETIERETIESLGQVRGRSEAMVTTANGMTASATRTGGFAHHATEAAALALANTRAVATAAENLAVSIKEIGDQATHSTAIVGRAITASTETRTAIEALIQKVGQIGRVAD